MNIKRQNVPTIIVGAHVLKGATMANKRENGGGTYFISKPDGTWSFLIFLGYDDNGKLLRKAFYGKTKQKPKLKPTSFLKNPKKGKPSEKYVTESLGWNGLLLTKKILLRIILTRL